MKYAQAERRRCKSCQGRRQLLVTTTAMIRGAKRTVIRRVVCPCSLAQKVSR